MSRKSCTFVPEYRLPFLCLSIYGYHLFIYYMEVERYMVKGWLKNASRRLSFKGANDTKMNELRLYGSE